MVGRGQYVIDGFVDVVVVEVLVEDEERQGVQRGPHNPGSNLFFEFWIIFSELRIRTIPHPDFGILQSRRGSVF